MKVELSSKILVAYFLSFPVREGATILQISYFQFAPEIFVLSFPDFLKVVFTN